MLKAVSVFLLVYKDPSPTFTFSFMDSQNAPESWNEGVKQRFGELPEEANWLVDGTH